MSHAQCVRLDRPVGGAGWALTRMRNSPFVLHCRRQGISTVAVCGTEL